MDTPCHFNFNNLIQLCKVRVRVCVCEVIKKYNCSSVGQLQAVSPIRKCICYYQHLTKRLGTI